MLYTLRLDRATRERLQLETIIDGQPQLKTPLEVMTTTRITARAATSTRATATSMACRARKSSSTRSGRRSASLSSRPRPSRNAAEAEDADFRTADSAVMVAAPHVASTRSVYQRKTRSAGTCQCA